MQGFADALSYVILAAFLGLGLGGLRLWWRQRDASSRWFALTFLTLTVVTIVGAVTPEDPESSVEHLIAKLTICVLLLFPYSLYRFTTTFKRPTLRVEIAMSAIAAGLIVWTLLLPDLPAEGEQRPSWWGIYLVGILTYWTLLSLFAAARLWRGGRGEPTLARNRMRMLGLGSIGLNVALIVAGAAPEEGSVGVDLAAELMALLAAGLFYVGFSPPQVLRLAWRRREQESLQRAIAALMGATEEDEIADALLPHVASLFGGRSAALVDGDGAPIGSHGVSDQMASDIRMPEANGEPVRKPNFIRVEMPFGALLVWGTPFTPFFATQDIELLHSLGVLTSLALERCRYIEKEREQKEQLKQVNQDLADAQTLAQLGSWEWNVPEDTITWSEQLYQLFGVNPAEFEASYEAYINLVHPDDRDAITVSIDKAHRTGEFDEVEHRVARPDGSVRWVRSRGKVVQNADGTVTKMLGTAQDITEHKLAEEYERELREAEIRQKQALELNDNVVQGLAVAGMAMELKETEKAKEAIGKTMAAAQAIITGLLRGAEDKEIKPGDLIRSRAAGLTDRPSRSQP